KLVALQHAIPVRGLQREEIRGIQFAVDQMLHPDRSKVARVGTQDFETHRQLGGAAPLERRFAPEHLPAPTFPLLILALAAADREQVFIIAFWRTEEIGPADFVSAAFVLPIAYSEGCDRGVGTGLTQEAYHR